MDDGSSKPTAQSPAGPGSVELPRGGLRNQAEALASGPTNGLRSQLLSLLLWLMVALLLRWLVVEPRWIPSGSMLPTLQLQDRILVEKVRPHLGRNFKPGTVVVFHPPAQLVEAGYSPSSALIKRVVAGPGDRVEILAGRLLRNGARARGCVRRGADRRARCRRRARTLDGRVRGGLARGLLRGGGMGARDHHAEASG